MEIIHALWPDENPFRTPRQVLVDTLAETLGRDAGQFQLDWQPDERFEFSFDLHTLPTEVQSTIGTSTLLAAWNAAIYVAQIEDEQLAEVLRSNDYLEVTSGILHKYGRLWFLDESFVVCRRA